MFSFSKIFFLIKVEQLHAALQLGKDAASPFALLFPCTQKTSLLVISERCMEIPRLLPITTWAFHPLLPAKKCTAKEAINPTSLDLCAPAVFSSAAGWIRWLAAFLSQKWARPWSCRQLVLVPPGTSGGIRWEAQLTSTGLLVWSVASWKLWFLDATPTPG